jgi:thioredoxin 1
MFRATPEMEQISDRDDFSIVKVNVDDEEDLARKFGVMSIPAVFIFKDGKMVDQKVGFMSRDDLLSWVDSNK